MSIPYCVIVLAVRCKNTIEKSSNRQMLHMQLDKAEREKAKRFNKKWWSFYIFVTLSPTIF